MDVKDLRIGNLVSVNGEGVYKISGIGGEKGLGIQNIDGSLPKGLPDGWKITPIKLTDEILQKTNLKCKEPSEWMGEKYRTFNTCGLVPYSWVEYNEEKSKWEMTSADGLEIILEYFHQLQNISHSLTGKELEVKL